MIDDKKKEEIKGLLSLIRNRVVTGLFLVIPVGVSLWLAYIVFNFLTEWSKPIIQGIPLLAPYEDELWFGLTVRFTSLIAIFVLLFGVGQLARHTFGRKFLVVLETLMLKVPMLNTVYSTTRQIVDAVTTPGAGMFSRTVLIEFPRKGIYALGFITNDNNRGSEISKKTRRDDLVTVFYPTTPNPTSGFLVFLPREDCIFLEMGITDSMKLIISGGAISSNSTFHNGISPEDKLSP